MKNKIDPNYIQFKPKTYWDSPSEMYVWWRKKGLMLKWFLEIIKNKKKLRVLDVGCNRCEDMFVLKNACKDKKIEFVGIDSSKLTIDNMKDKVPFKIHNMDGCNIDKKLGKFDIVICSEVLEHAKSQFLLIRNLHDILKPEGHLILTTPNKDTFFKKLVLKLPFVKEKQKEFLTRHDYIEEDYFSEGGFAHHEYEVNKSKLERLLVFSGFEILKLKSSCISYGSPILDKNRFLFIMWLILDIFFSGFDLCVLAQKESLYEK